MFFNPQGILCFRELLVKEQIEIYCIRPLLHAFWDHGWMIYAIIIKETKLANKMGRKDYPERKIRLSTLQDILSTFQDVEQSPRKIKCYSPI